MAITPILAMTAAEMQNLTTLPPKIAWMACHFSSSGPGLSNLPEKLPAGSVLILDDSTPIDGHDPELIRTQLSEHSAEAIVLDFQRAENTETAALVSFLSEGLPCPVIVSDSYAADNNLPVFLSPVPPSVAVQEWFSPWKNREIWLDAGCWGEILTLTEQGCQCVPWIPIPFPEGGFADEVLHCHYHIKMQPGIAEISLWRTKEDQLALWEDAASLGADRILGLYQELQRITL